MSSVRSWDGVVAPLEMVDRVVARAGSADWRDEAMDCLVEPKISLAFA